MATFVWLVTYQYGWDSESQVAICSSVEGAKCAAQVDAENREAVFVGDWQEDGAGYLHRRVKREDELYVIERFELQP